MTKINEDTDNKKTIIFEVRKPDHESLFNMETIIDAQIAVIYKKQMASCMNGDGGVLNDKDFKRLEQLVKMKKDLYDMRQEVKKESFLEGKTNEEIKELAEQALRKINGK